MDSWQLYLENIEEYVFSIWRDYEIEYEYIIHRKVGFSYIKKIRNRIFRMVEA